MADCFKIFQYYYFEHIDTPNTSGASSGASGNTAVSVPMYDHSTNIIVALNIHFVKPTMFKGQVNSGVKVEVTEVAKRWVQYSINKIQQFYSMNVSENIDHLKDDFSHLQTPAIRSRTSSIHQQQVISNHQTADQLSVTNIVTTTSESVVHVQSEAGTDKDIKIITPLKLKKVP